jgi:hypothetical protein
VAYLALAVALGGTTYAASRIDSGDVRNNSLKSKDIRNDKGVTGRDVANDSISGADVREATLEAAEFVALTRAEGSCETSTSPNAVSCAPTVVRLPARSRVLAVATAIAGPSAQVGSCDVLFDGRSGGGLLLANNDDVSEHFTVTGLSGTLSPGDHEVALECSTSASGPEISQPTITVFGIGEFD